MKVLVTGGSGFIGSHITERLIHDGNHVVVLDNLSNGIAANLKECLNNTMLSFRNGDVRDVRVVNECVKSVEAIIHLAALTASTGSVERPVELTDVNVGGTVNLLEAARRGDIHKFILASSAAVYGDSARFPLKERFQTSALSPYAASKIAAERYCHSFREAHGIRAVSLRFFNVYGPRQRADDGGVIARFVSRIKRGLAPEIFGDGEQTRDFIHVSDVVESVVRVLGNGINDERLNVGSGFPVTINHVAETLLRIFGSSQRPSYLPALQGEIRNSYASTARIEKSLHFRPRVVLESGLQQMVSEESRALLTAEELA